MGWSGCSDPLSLLSFPCSTEACKRMPHGPLPADDMEQRIDSLLAHKGSHRTVEGGRKGRTQEGQGGEAQPVPRRGSSAREPALSHRQSLQRQVDTRPAVTGRTMCYPATRLGVEPDVEHVSSALFHEAAEDNCTMQTTILVETCVPAHSPSENG